MDQRPALLALVLLVGTRPGLAQSSDSAFAAVQHRGAMVMGVDQDASRHVFEDLPDGGRIIFAMRDTTDAAGTAAIRVHLRSIAESFGAGNFADPSRVHAMEVPGTARMSERRDRIRYTVRQRPGGAELWIQTLDGEALAAVREFLAFQRMDHRAPGSDSMPDHGQHDHRTHQHGTR